MIHRCGSSKSRKEVQVHTVVRFKEPKNNKITQIKKKLKGSKCLPQCE
jgi:hypothetical protein